MAGCFSQSARGEFGSSRMASCDRPLFTVPDVEPGGESGLMSVALHPQFASNHLLYLSYAYKGDGQRVRVVRYRESGSGLAEPKVIIENIPAAQFHAGCRLRFWTRRQALHHDR